MRYRYRFFKRGLILTLTALAMRTVGMFFGAYVTKTIGAEGVGLYTMVMTVYSFAVTLASSGISLTVTRLVAAAIGEESGIKTVLFSLSDPENIIRAANGENLGTILYN